MTENDRKRLKMTKMTEIIKNDQKFLKKNTTGEQETEQTNNTIFHKNL